MHPELARRKIILYERVPVQPWILFNSSPFSLSRETDIPWKQFECPYVQLEGPIDWRSASRRSQKCLFFSFLLRR